MKDYDLQVDKKIDLTKPCNIKSRKPLPINEISKLEYSYSYANFDIPPCVYFLYFNDTLVYIGSTTRLPARICEHLKDKDKEFNKVFYIPIQKHLLRETEEKLIKYYIPYLNNETFLNQNFKGSLISVHDLKDKIINQIENPDIPNQIYFNKNVTKSNKDKFNEMIKRIIQEETNSYNKGD